MGNGIGTLKRSRVSESIKSMILTQRVRPGERLSERRLADILGVARGTVRESLVRLTNEGFLENIPGMGSFVKNYSDEELCERIYLRAMHEGVAARFAAEKINRRQGKDLRGLVEQLRNSFEKADHETNRQIDMEIHETIAEICGNKFLKSLISSGLGLRVMAYVNVPPSGDRNISKRQMTSTDEHAAIVNAIIAGEAEKAEELMRAHITKSIETFSRMVHDTMEQKG